MNQRQLTQILGGFAGAEAGYPFGPAAQVWKVGGNIFAIVGEDARVEARGEEQGVAEVGTSSRSSGRMRDRWR